MQEGSGTKLCLDLATKALGVDEVAFRAAPAHKRPSLRILGHHLLHTIWAIWGEIRIVYGSCTYHVYKLFIVLILLDRFFRGVESLGDAVGIGEDPLELGEALLVLLGRARARLSIRIVLFMTGGAASTRTRRVRVRKEMPVIGFHLFMREGCLQV